MQLCARIGTITDKVGSSRSIMRIVWDDPVYSDNCLMGSLRFVTSVNNVYTLHAIDSRRISKTRSVVVKCYIDVVGMPTKRSDLRLSLCMIPRQSMTSRKNSCKVSPPAGSDIILLALVSSRHSLAERRDNRREIGDINTTPTPPSWRAWSLSTMKRGELFIFSSSLLWR